MTIYWNFEKSSPRIVATGESNQSAGSRSASTQYSCTDNLIKFPAPSLPADSEQPSGALPFIDDDTGVACALAVVVSCFVTALSALLYAGYKLFFLFDLG